MRFGNLDLVLGPRSRRTGESLDFCSGLISSQVRGENVRGATASDNKWARASQRASEPAKRVDVSTRGEGPGKAQTRVGGGGWGDGILSADDSMRRESAIVKEMEQVQLSFLIIPIGWVENAAIRCMQSRDGFLQ